MSDSNMGNELYKQIFQTDGGGGGGGVVLRFPGDIIGTLDKQGHQTFTDMRLSYSCRALVE